MTLKHIHTRFLIPAFLMICLILSGCKDKTVTHTVTFDSNGGSEVASQSVDNGETAVEPKSPEKEGFTFTEWLLDDTAFDFTAPITQDITLTASYTINEGTEIILVTFDAANKSSAKEIEIIKGGTVTPPADPSRDGFEFAGWYLDGKEFDFSSPLSENVTLRAKWNKVETTEEAEGSEEESSKESKPGASDNRPGSSQGQQGGSTPTTPSGSSSANTTPSQKSDPEALTAQYSGTWYLQGYADVYLNIYKEDSYMRIDSTNLSLYSGLAPIFDANAFILYPRNCDYSTENMIYFPDWEEDLTRIKTVLGNNCIYIGQYRFVRTKGTTDRYSDTCYRAALGTWSLENHPNSQLEIGTSFKSPSPSRSDEFYINPINFDLTTLTVANGGSPTVFGIADQPSEFTKYGISVSNDILTVSNSYGTKRFYRYSNIVNPDDVTLTLDREAVTAYVGDTFTLHATLHPATAVDPLAWMEHHSSIATVDDNGNVTCHKAGTTQIDVLTADYSIHASCIVTVIDRPVTSVSISQTSADLKVGNTLQLSASANPSNATNRNITWSSSNSAIAKVSTSGLVTAISSGEVTITAKSAWDNSISATCHITVTKEPAQESMPSESTPSESTPSAPLEARASVGNGETVDSTGTHKFVTASIYASGGSGSYTYQMNVYRNGLLVGSFNTDHEKLYDYTSGTFYIEFTVTDSSGQSIRGTSSSFTLS